ncbi:MAG TPA: right-handed parallel beta-helix repeat-containing protein, partial [bacterium]|nr:right-handed parallel beta-helix repeat-containing protein [bacterium]
ILYLPGGSEGTGDVTDCIVRGAGLYSVEAGSGAANITVERNILVDPGVFGFICANGAATIVRNNTILGAGDCGIYADFSIGFAEFICERNILVQNSVYGIACFSPQPPTLDCNVLFDNGVSAYSPECNPGAGDLETDPMFCDLNTYTLLPGSPCAPANAGACQAIGAVETVCAQ